MKLIRLSFVKKSTLQLEPYGFYYSIFSSRFFIVIEQVWITWTLVALNTKKTVAISLNGVPSWKSARTHQATRPFWRTLTFWHVMPQFAKPTASYQSLNQKSYPMVITIWTAAKKSPKPSWPPYTKHWATITSTWKVPSWNQTWSPQDKTPPNAPPPPKSVWPHSPLCVALFQLPFQVNTQIAAICLELKFN